jgi:hypothetical protein
MIQLTTASHCLAMLRARQAVKDSLRAHGVKVSQMSARDISIYPGSILKIMQPS